MDAHEQLQAAINRLNCERLSGDLRALLRRAILDGRMVVKAYQELLERRQREEVTIEHEASDDIAELVVTPLDVQWTIDA